MMRSYGEDKHEASTEIMSIYRRAGALLLNINLFQTSYTLEKRQNNLITDTDYGS